MMASSRSCIIREAAQAEVVEMKDVVEATFEEEVDAPDEAMVEVEDGHGETVIDEVDADEAMAPEALVGAVAARAELTELTRRLFPFLCCSIVSPAVCNAMSTGTACIFLHQIRALNSGIALG